MKRVLFTLLLLCAFVFQAQAQNIVSIPDERLEQAIREHLAHLNIPENEPILQEDILHLTHLVAQNAGITDLTGIQEAKNLEFLDVGRNNISDISTIATLIELEILKLFENQIVDISPIAGLVNLTELQFTENQIVDISPVATLTGLEILFLGGNRIVDISPLAGLVNLTALYIQYNEIADFTPIRALTNLNILHSRENPADIAPILQLTLDNFGTCEIHASPKTERIENREYPSVFAAWANIIKLPTVPEHERLAYHDLYFCCPMFGLYFVESEDNIYLVGDIEAAKQQTAQLKASNPDIILLVAIPYFSGAQRESHPDDWANWLRDENGEIVIDPFWDEALLDFTLPETQAWTLAHVRAVAQCGLFDGIFLDHWNDDPRLAGYRPLEEEYEARDKILEDIRDAVGDDFLIQVNTNRETIPRWAAYVNGTFMEFGATQHTEYNIFQSRGYRREDLLTMESTLLWSELNMRQPQINGLETFGLIEEFPDSPQNLQWMRLFTTLGLTHSDGYVLYSIGSGSLLHEHPWDNQFLELTWGHANQQPHVHDHDHYWYEFWDAPLGKPIGGDETKAQTYNGRAGVFIREYTHGWAVYNRSGETQAIQFPVQVKSWHSQDTGTDHLIADLDGEIYLKYSFDVNADGVVNILDLVIVANALGDAVPDLNADGVVNILDLVIVANNFGN